MIPEPSLPRASTPPPLADEQFELTLEEQGGASIELGTLLYI